MRQHSGECATVPWGREGPLLERVLLDEALEMLFEFAGHFARSSRARAIEEALGPLPGKALHPFAQGGIGETERGGDRANVLPSDDLPDSLCPAKNAGLPGLLEYGLSGRQRIMAKVAFERTHRFAPGRCV